MGNCLGNPDNSAHTTRPSSPGTSKNYSNNRQLSSSGGTNFSSVGGGTVSSSSVGTSGGGGGIGTEEAEFPDGRILSTPDLRVFSFAELRNATNNFKNENVLGEGGFGRVYKGYVDEKTTKSGSTSAVAIKKLNPESMQGLEEWESEVKFLGSLSHPNLVKLIGYCWEEKELLLVYEHMPRGNLENHLFGRNSQPLSWDIRFNILIGVARGLAFLHSSERQIIYRDFKGSNILLDLRYNAKLSDFGLAKHGPMGGESHVTTRVMGTYGYAAPEYVATGHLYVKSDVYGFGVVLLEMLTGQRAVDTNRPSGQHNLVDMARPNLSNRRKLVKIMDARLEDQYPVKGALQAAALALNCLEQDPKNRPSMKEVVKTLEQIQAIKEKPRVPRPSQSHAHRLSPQRSPTHSRFDGDGVGGVRSRHRSPNSR